MFDVARLSRENTLLNKRKRYSIKRVKTIKGDIMNYIIIMLETIAGVFLTIGFCVLGVYIVKTLCNKIN